jgi:predicted type IV restriction endonuclease
VWIPKKVQDRLVAGLRRYQPIVRKLKERDISEADTVTVVKDMLSDIFGYDKYTELTSEQQIRGTFCDLAIRVGEKVHYLAEVKSAGTSLNDSHLRQAVNYGAHHGIEWILLTNAITWKVYRIRFAQPIDWDEVCCFEVGDLSSRVNDDLAKLYLLCRESVSTDVLKAYHRQGQILNRYVIAELLQSDALLSTLRREFRRLFDMKTSNEELHSMLLNLVVKRDALDGEQSKAAKATVKKAVATVSRKQTKTPAPPLASATTE